MYIRNDGQLLKTKIIATIGAEKCARVSPSGQEYQEVEYEKLFKWFLQPKSNSFMVDILRLNMAFYSPKKGEEQYRKIFNWLEKEKNSAAKNVGVLCDLAGAKTRLGEIESEAGKDELRIEGEFRLNLAANIKGNRQEASVLAYGEPLENLPDYSNTIYPRLSGFCGKNKPGIEITVGDGKTFLKAYDLKDNILYCKVEREGIIKSNWGITFEKPDLGLPSFQKADQEALEFILGLDAQRGFISAIGVSFVRTAKDIINVRRFIEEYYKNRCHYNPIDARLCCPNIIAKIETKKGAEHIDEILDVADGAMIARGDLANQLSREEVPQKQKEIINLCNKRGKIAITATEMLASMEENIMPTRAEVNDVFNSIMDGTDAVMLSSETSSGKYPAQAVEYMNKIAEKAEIYFEKIYARGSSINLQRIQELREGSEKLIEETHARLEQQIHDYDEEDDLLASEYYREKLEKSQDQRTTDRICASACELVEEQEFQAVVASTASGRTVRMLSRFRPSVKLIGVIYDDRCRHKLLLTYGARPVSLGSKSYTADDFWKDPNAVFQKAAEYCLKENLVKKSEHAVFVSGSPLGYYGQGKVNILQIKEF